MVASVTRFLESSLEAGSLPRPPPEVDGWTWTTRVVDGQVVEEILGAAGAESADLLVLTTHGKHGFLDALRGSTTEHVIRRTRCPLLAVPTLPSEIGILVSEP